MSRITFIYKRGRSEQGLHVASHSADNIKLLAWDEDLGTDLAVLNFRCYNYGKAKGEELVGKLNDILHENNGKKVLAFKGYSDEMKHWKIEGLDSWDPVKTKALAQRIETLLGRRPSDGMRNQNLQTIVKELMKNKEKEY